MCVCLVCLCVWVWDAALLLVRMMVLHPQAAKQWALPAQPLDLVALICNVAMQSTKETVHLLALRALTNFFGRHALAKHIVKQSEQVLDLVATIFET